MPVEIEFGLAVIDCHLATPSVTPQVEVTVVDADNHPVPATYRVAPGDYYAHDWNMLPSTVSSGFAQLIDTTVTFTPATTGPHHLGVELFTRDPLLQLGAYGVAPHAYADGGVADFRDSTSWLYWEINAGVIDYLPY